MKVKHRVLIMTAVMVVSTSIYVQAWGWGLPIKPGDHVFDAARKAQWVLTEAQMYATALNSTAKILNQLKDLEPMNPETSKANVNDLNHQVGQVIAVMNSVKGLMNKEQSAEQAWQGIFDTNFKTMTANDQLSYHQKILSNLDRTYLDSLQFSMLNSQVDSEIELLNKGLANIQDPSGNKSLKQAKAVIEASHVTGAMKTNQLAGQLVSIAAAQEEYSNKKEEEARMNAKQQMSAGAADPYNPTEDDKKNFTRPKGKGFVHF